MAIHIYIIQTFLKNELQIHANCMVIETTAAHLQREALVAKLVDAQP